MNQVNGRNKNPLVEQSLIKPTSCSCLSNTYYINMHFKYNLHANYLLYFSAGPFTTEPTEERRLAASFGLVTLDLTTGWTTSVVATVQQAVVRPAGQAALGQLPPPSARLDRRLIQRSGTQRDPVTLGQN